MRSKPVDPKRFWLFLLILINSTISCSVAKNSSTMDLKNYPLMISSFADTLYTGSGTGFLVRYNGQFYLVSNFHVFTGLYPLDNTPVEKGKPGNTDIVVVFLPKEKGNLIYHPMKFKLYGDNGIKNYNIVGIDSVRKMDLAIMPIAVPEGVLLYYFDEKHIDGEKNYKDGLELSICGFSDGKFVDKTKPAIIETKSVNANYNGENVFDWFVHYDKPTKPGTSGSPILYKTSSGAFKVIGVNATATGSKKDYDNPNIEGSGVLMHYVMELIKNVDKYQKPPIQGVFVRGL
jgi:hypothetical protein